MLLFCMQFLNVIVNTKKGVLDGNHPMLDWVEFWYILFVKILQVIINTKKGIRQKPPNVKSGQISVYPFCNITDRY